MGLILLKQRRAFTCLFIAMTSNPGSLGGGDRHGYRIVPESSGGWRWEALEGATVIAVDTHRTESVKLA